MLLLSEVKDGAADVPWDQIQSRNVYRSVTAASSCLCMEKYQQDKVGLSPKSVGSSSCSLTDTHSPKSRKPNLKCAVMQCPPHAAEQSQRTPRAHILGSGDGNAALGAAVLYFIHRSPG